MQAHYAEAYHAMLCIEWSDKAEFMGFHFKSNIYPVLYALDVNKLCYMHFLEHTWKDRGPIK